MQYSIKRRRRRRRKVSLKKNAQTSSDSNFSDKKPRYKASKEIYAPVNFRLNENLKGCLKFFSECRVKDNRGWSERGVSFVSLNLENVEFIDYESLSILLAIQRDLRYNGVVICGILPRDLDCKKFIIDSGFLNGMRNSKNGEKYNFKSRSKFISIKGSLKLRVQDQESIDKICMDVHTYLFNQEGELSRIFTIIKEICGNALEYCGKQNNEWCLGVFYEDDKVIYTITDVGQGILNSLNVKYHFDVVKKVFGFGLFTNVDILKQAFKKKYGSSTEEVNRNKGLPSIKSTFEDGFIKNLILLTNDAFLHFEDDSKSRSIPSKIPPFIGTFYKWEIDKDCKK